jgi:hypothetical protein
MLFSSTFVPKSNCIVKLQGLIRLWKPLSGVYKMGLNSNGYSGNC